MISDIKRQHHHFPRPEDRRKLGLDRDRKLEGAPDRQSVRSHARIQTETARTPAASIRSASLTQSFCPQRAKRSWPGRRCWPVFPSARPTTKSGWTTALAAAIRAITAPRPTRIPFSEASFLKGHIFPVHHSDDHWAVFDTRTKGRQRLALPALLPLPSPRH